MASEKLSIIIPVFNEVNTLAELVGRVSAVNLRKEIIIVDDGSTDGTSELAKSLATEIPDVEVLVHESNRGKGAALSTGLKHCTGAYVIFQDADLEYSPEEYPLLIEPLQTGRADVVYGSRFRGGGSGTMSLGHRLGNRFLTWLTNRLYGAHLSDMETCYKVFRTDVVRRIRIESRGFDVEPEVTAKLLRLNVRVEEVPISYQGRSHEEGKKISWKDGLAAVWALVRYRFGDM